MAFGKNPNQQNINPNDFVFTNSSALLTCINAISVAMTEFRDDATPTANFIFQSVHQNIFGITDKAPLTNFPIFLIESIVDDIALLETTTETTLNCFAILKSTKDDVMISKLPQLTSKLRKVFNEPEAFPLLWPNGNALNERRFRMVTLERSAGLPQRVFPDITDREPFWTISMTMQIKLTGY